MKERLIDITNMSDHDLLIHVATVVDIVHKGQENHLEHHRKHDLTMLSVTLGAIFTAIIAIGSAVIAILN